MKNTIIMLSVMVAIFATWMLLSGITYFCSDVTTFKEAATSGPVVLITLILSCVSASIVANDVENLMK